jgi:YebC/PmpR family DNA-binding regulatory protein
MSGHSKWSTIKHKKAIKDAKRSNVFTKHAKLIEVAARGGGDPEMNFGLRMAIDSARAVNMPKDNIQRAIKRGTGETKDGVELFEITYEGYGPGQVALLIQCVTDNKNRTLSDVKTIFKKNKGKFVEGGGVSWQFEQKGLIVIEGVEESEKEDVEMQIIEAGADDYEFTDEEIVIYTKGSELNNVQKFLKKEVCESSDGKIKIAEAKIILEAKEKVAISGEELADLEILLDLFDENDDVVDVWTALE